MHTTVRIPSRFRGPATSANGGYTAGVLAVRSGLDPVGAAAGQPYGETSHASVRLRTPPPLGTSLDLEDAVDETGARRAWLRYGTTFVAEARLARLEVMPVPAVDVETARAAAGAYAGLRKHPFPGCFVCGPTRDPDDGLRLFPGRTSPGHTACVFVPPPSILDDDGNVPPEMVWAALDCPGGWTADIEGRPMVLGTMTARVDRVPLRDEPCVITGALLDASGRRAETATTMYGADGSVVALAHAVWVQIDADAFNKVFAPADPV